MQGDEMDLHKASKNLCFDETFGESALIISAWLWGGNFLLRSRTVWSFINSNKKACLSSAITARGY